MNWFQVVTALMFAFILVMFLIDGVIKKNVEDLVHQIGDSEVEVTEEDKTVERIPECSDEVFLLNKLITKCTNAIETDKYIVYCTGFIVSFFQESNSTHRIKLFQTSKPYWVLIVGDTDYISTDVLLLKRVIDEFTDVLLASARRALSKDLEIRDAKVVSALKKALDS